ncbi:CesT family type III secretion system chaperone [Roseateles amylovorans]|jgi:Tir chaperone protein (CesT) family|uniref:CesT family type III secretion system chaperone n=1 Tax=Roseateles amylovorans TaxID=2978473 RepID=A0ABY6AZF2_9BURK|nr:CesT family type III secretion system chaperone [Roseateles amylovorans]UXH78293.1 CesT family type III secretion system chaperone [Roseateles amylovorans]
MSYDRYCQLIRELCEVVELPDAETAIARNAIEVEGFEVLLGHYDNDPEAMYLNFTFGSVTSGRSLRVFRLMLEANLTLYAQDQAQLGLDADTGLVLLIVRIPMTHDTDGVYLADTFNHYAEHGRYWRENILVAEDEMFESLSHGDYAWLRV